MYIQYIVHTLFTKYDFLQHNYMMNTIYEIQYLMEEFISQAFHKKSFVYNHTYFSNHPTASRADREETKRKAKR